MADNFTVLQSTGATITLRYTETGSSIWTNMSIPADNSGTTMVSSAATFTSTAQSAAVVVVSSLSGPQIVNLSSNPTITSLTSGNVVSKGSYGAAQLTQASVSVSASSNNTLVARAVGTIKVYGLLLVPDSPVTMTFFNGSSASILSGAMNLGTLFLPIQTEPYFTTTGTNNFVLNLSSSGQVSGMIYYLDN